MGVDVAAAVKSGFCIPFKPCFPSIEESEEEVLNLLKTSSSFRNQSCLD